MNISTVNLQNYRETTNKTLQFAHSKVHCAISTRSIAVKSRDSFNGKVFSITTIRCSVAYGIQKLI